jgi:hypothetical protein
VTISDAGTMQGGAAAPSTSYQVGFALGTDSDLISQDSYGCRLKWNVNGGTASLVLGQACTAGNTYSVLTGGFTLTPSDATHLSANANVTGLCNADACSAAGVGTLVKQ